ncbi:MAG: hypothetical protein ABSA03_14900 [Streptosporangiaceae bacterium]
MPAAWLIEHAGFARGYPASPQPASGQPGGSEPGGSEPGGGEPGRGEPGRGEPGRGEPGRGEPGGGEWPGQGMSGARISTKHTLALVNPGGATTASLLALAREIRNGVRDTFGVELVNEPVLVGANL